MTDSNLQSIAKAIALVKDYPNETIEASVIEYVCDQIGEQFHYEDDFLELRERADQKLIALFGNMHFPIDIEYIIEFFEALLEKDNIAENGIVFTPRYIADYINENVLNDIDGMEVRTIDPGCGCGIFLVSAADKLKEKTKKCIAEILRTSIYGMDIDADNVRRCKIVLNLFALMNGESNRGLELNIICVDSLKTDWGKVFDVENFDCIIGNPPYVNPHDMNKETAQFLKKTFQTTKTGVYNIFYAFIEYAMRFLSDTGKLSYIVPNNFLTIKSAKDLRELLAHNHWIEKIIDFSNNMVFKPVRTYNCIIELSKKENETFAYCVMDKTDHIPETLNSLQFGQMHVDKLDAHGWHLVDKSTMANILKIEGQHRSIKGFVRTGIATLKDEIYMVEFDGDNFYKDVAGVKYIVESELVKRLYKIPDLKQSDGIQSICRYIIFPYKMGESGFEIIPEEEIITKYPHTYHYLLSRKSELDKRDKGKPNTVAWYAYGRTQGLNKYGKKLLFPTFAHIPRFTMIEDESALFCNGYAVFENEYMDLEILQRVLNSIVMQYYVCNTSYAIEGGYYCYQKKYIEKFTLPFFDEEEKTRIAQMSKEELDAFLIEKYELDI